MAGNSDPIDRSYQREPVNDLIVRMEHVSEKTKVHPAFQVDLPEYIWRSPELIDHANRLAAVRDAAAGHDQEQMAAMKALQAKAVDALNDIADHLIKLARHRNDPSLLLNAGFSLKQKSIPKARPKLVDLIPEVLLKHAKGLSGVILILLKLAQSKASTELQITENPQDENSWRRIGEGIHNKARIEMRGLKPASTIYVRARYHQEGAVGKWSVPDSIIVL